MVTLNEMRYQILESLNQYSDDSRITTRLVDDLIKTKRTSYIRKEHNRNRSIDSTIIQRLKCVDLMLLDTIECPEVCASGAKILRTAKKIPNTVELYHEKTITNVSIVGLMNIPIYVMDYDHAIFWGNGRFNKNRIGFFLLNNYGYIVYNQGIENSLLEQIEIQGVFEDPKEAAQFADCDGVSCWTPDTQYPINLWMWDIIKADIIKELTIKLQLKTDKTNNADDDTEPSTLRNGE